MSEAEEGTEVYDRIASKKMLFGLAASLNHTLKEGAESDEVEVFLFELMDNHPRIYNQLATIAKSREAQKLNSPHYKF